jgi:FkbM family methyltransferase
MRAILSPDDEARLVREFFGGAAGYFVEVGANEPKQWSQTFHLEERGWTGVLIEPQPLLAEKLRQQRTAKVYAVACSSPANAGKSMTLHLAGGRSSLDAEFFAFQLPRDSSIEVPIKTLDQVLIDTGAPAPVDLVSIDVENHEIEVLAGFDIQRWQPRLLLIEDHVRNLRLHRYLRSHGYKWVRRTALNAWYVPDAAPMRVSWLGRFQFIRKYVLGVPFRHLRDAMRRLRPRWMGRSQ